jgi:arabinofuranosyltransferase
MNNTRTPAIMHGVLALIIPLLVLLLHISYYFPYFVDDAFISMRYSQRLIDGQGLTWNNGEYVEGYSNLLWVLLIAGFGALGIDMLSAARFLGLASSIVTMLAFCYYALRLSNISSTALFFGNMAFALAAPVAIWSIAGLECTLVMALLAWVYVLALVLLERPSKKNALECGVLLGLLCLCRPEGPVFTIAIAAGLFLFTAAARTTLLPSLFILCAVPATFYLSQIGFRLSYYGELFANTVHAKVTFTASRLLNGVMYVIKALALFLPLWLIIALKADVLRRDSILLKRIYFLLFVSVIWLLTLSIGGGDFFPGFRHILVLVPVIILLYMEAVERVCAASAPYWGKQFFLAYLLACFLWLQFSFKENMYAKETQEWVDEGVNIGKVLGRIYHDSQPLVAVGLAGVIPFYSDLPSLDMYGLTDPYMSMHPGDEFGHGFIGHDLLNADYVLSRKPDIIVFFLGKTAPLHEFNEHKDFKEKYFSKEIVLPDYTATIWLRKDSHTLKPVELW